MIQLMVIIMCLLPFIVLVFNAFLGRLGANPPEAIIHQTGLWSLRLLLLTLSVTPIRLLTGWHSLNKKFDLRKIFGLSAFYYSCLHVLAYVAFEHSFDVLAIVIDIGQRPAITIGFLAFVAMIPLAVTSKKTLIKWLGKQRWKQLHWLIYPITIAGVVHFWWLAQAKADILEPLIYALVLALLLLLRYPPLITRLTPPQK